MKLQRQLRQTEADGQPPKTTPSQEQSPEPVKIEHVFQHLGLKAENIKTLDDFKNEVNQNFIRRDQEIIRGDSELYAKLMGSKTKGTMTAIARALRENGVTLTDDEMKEPKLETFAENMVNRAAKINQEKIAELEAKVNSGDTGTDEKVKTLQTELETTKNKLQETTTKLTSTETEWQQKLQQKEMEFKNLNRQTAKDREWGGFKWAATANELVQDGFKARIEKTFNFEFDDSGKLTPYDKDGKRIPNPNVKDTFYTVEELLKAEGVKAGVYAINQHGKGAPPPAQRKETPAVTTPVEGQGQRVNTLRPKVAIRQ